jgi:hypothetical protein
VPAPSGPPIGATEWAVPFGDTYAVVNGWAGDFDAPNAPIAVMYLVNGRIAGLFMADRSRPDVAADHPPLGPNHGYTAAIKAPGTTAVVCSYALNVGPGGSMPIGCTAVHRPVKPVVKAKTVVKKKVVKKKKVVAKRR